MRLTGLAAHIAPDCRVLVLGSMPGNASLQAARYYAHPRNRFWPVMAAVCGFDIGLSYELRLQALQRAGVGLWDVIGQCSRAGSLDSAIVRGSEVINPIDDLIGTSDTLQVVALNGAKAADAFRRHVATVTDPARLRALQVLPLPSTSPANAGMSLPRLQQAWSALRPWCQPVSP